MRPSPTQIGESRSSRGESMDCLMWQKHELYDVQK
jgi:hypothetical protein